MKCITAVIRPFKLDEVKGELDKLGLGSMTVTEVRGYGRIGKVALYPGAEYVLDFVPKYEIKLVVPDDQVEPVLEIIVEQAKTGESGDGIAMVTPVETVVSIRSGKRGEDALS